MPPKKFRKKDVDRIKKEKHIERRDKLGDWLDYIRSYIENGHKSIIMHDEMQRELFPDLEPLTYIPIDRKLIEKYNVFMAEYYELNITDPYDPYTKKELIAELNPNDSEFVRKSYENKTMDELREIAIEVHKKNNDKYLQKW